MAVMKLVTATIFLGINTPPPPKILPAAFFVFGIKFVGITGKIGNMVTGNNFWGITSIELPESLATLR